MFATSVPISLAGWGMRELSAVVGLGAIGVPAHAALTAAVTIGIGSLLVVGVLAAISVPQTSVRKQPKAVQPVKPVDYYRVLTGYSNSARPFWCCFRSMSRFSRG